jgi:hypothetical protein
VLKKGRFNGVDFDFEIEVTCKCERQPT